jgi:COMPASS component SWD1
MLRNKLCPVAVIIHVKCFIFQEFDGALDCISLAVTCAFNKRGTLLAVGCNDGRIVIWDFLTRGIAKIISAHVHPVCSLRLV